MADRPAPTPPYGPNAPIPAVMRNAPFESLPAVLQERLRTWLEDNPSKGPYGVRRSSA